MTWRIGIDIGGTFTDLTLLRADGSIVLWKEDSTPERHETAIERGLEGLARQEELTLAELLAGTELLVHGSTIATNAVIQRSGPTVGLVTTRGFRDVLYLRDGFKWDRYNIRLPRPADFVPRYLRLPVTERVAADGSVVTPLVEADVRKAAAAFRRLGVEAVAVALLWAHINPAHERAVRDVLGVELPDVPVMLSSEVLPEIGEWVRTSATVLSAYAYPASARYLRDLERWLGAAGFRGRLQLMQLNGGCAGTEQSLRVPANLIGSGPAAAPAAAIQAGRRVGSRDLIEVDMGGTSFDVCLIKDASIPRSRTLSVEYQPLGLPGVEIHSVGAGGGSIAWVDSGGALRVGPRSAGSRPGPVAYAQGGVEPTVTDADVVLGYLSPTRFHAGRRSLDRDRAEAAIRTRIAEPLGLGVHEAAAGIVRVVNENMVNAIRVVSIERGIDPRPFTLVAGGGAGPLHAGRLAAQLGMRRVLFPREAGTLSAFGMTVTDVRHDHSATLHVTTPDVALDLVAGVLRRLEDRATEDLLRAGFAPDSMRMTRAVDARYLGQVHELMVPVPDGVLDDGSLASVLASFHAAHAERYAWQMPQHPVEFLHWRVTGVGVIARPEEAEMLQASASEAAPGEWRDAYFDDPGTYAATPVFDAGDLPAGSWVLGPAIIDAPTTTVVVNPGQAAIADGRGNHLLLTDAAQRRSS